MSWSVECIYPSEAYAFVSLLNNLPQCVLHGTLVSVYQWADSRRAVRALGRAWRLHQDTSDSVCPGQGASVGESRRLSRDLPALSMARRGWPQTRATAGRLAVVWGRSGRLAVLCVTLVAGSSGRGDAGTEEGRNMECMAERVQLKCLFADTQLHAAAAAAAAEVHVSRGQQCAQPCAWCAH